MRDTAFSHITSRYIGKYLSLALLLVVAISSMSIFVSTVVAHDPGTCFTASRTLYLLAVAQDPSTGKYFGVATEAQVYISPGEGSVYLSVEPMSQIDMQASLRIAYLIASHVAGVNASRYNIYVKVTSDTPIIGGPSASGYLTVAIASLLMNQSLRSGIVMTGMIMPDGLIGPVGGIPEKLMAAKSVGASVMLIPAGQRFSTDLNTGQKIDVVSEGARLGIRVIEVANIYDALRLFGVQVSEPQPINPKISSEVLSMLRRWASDLGEALNSSLKDLEALSSNTSLIPGIRGVVSSYINSAQNLSVRASEEFSRGDYYSAASDYFAALIYADTAKWTYILSSNISRYSDLYNSIGNMYSTALERYKELLKSVFESGCVDVSKLAVLNEIAYRIYDTNSSFSSLPRPGARTLSINDVYNAVYAYWRANSIFQWLEFYDIYPSSGACIPLQTLKRYGLTLINYVQTLATYLESLGVVLDVATSTRISNMINLALELYSESDYISSNALASYLSSLSTAYLQTVFTTNISETLHNIRDMALRYLGEIYSRGIDISIPSMYIIRGDSVAQTDPASAIYFYELSIFDTMWLASLSSESISTETMARTFATTSPGISTGTESPAAVSVEKSTTVSAPLAEASAYQAITSLVILVVGIVIVAALAIALTIRLVHKSEHR